MRQPMEFHLTEKDPTEKYRGGNDKRFERLALLKHKLIDNQKPDPHNFIGLGSDMYSSNVVTSDLAEISVMIDQQTRNRTPEKIDADNLAEAFEGAIIDLSQRLAWFGNRFYLRPTSDYDDQRRKVDAVGFFTDDQTSRNVGVAFDVTYSSSPTRLEHKLSQTAAAAERGELHSIKYFEDANGENRGEIRVPRLVIGAHERDVFQVVGAWGELHTSEYPEPWKDHLAAHPMQVKLLKEAEMQANYFARVALAGGHTETANAYRGIARLIGKLLLQDKRELFEMYQERFERDSTFREIKSFCSQ